MPEVMRRSLLISALSACLAAAGCASDEQVAPQRATVAAAPAPAPKTKLPPLPDDHQAKVVEPVAGAATPEPTPAPKPARTPKPAAKANGAASPSRALARPVTAGDGVHKATALPNGIALPPLDAPEAVRQMIDAGNVIARTPYLWGGGHGKWVDTGYDCSGSVSFVLAAAGYLDSPLASGPLMSWGEPGPGKWVTIYANQGHVWLTVAGIRFDTSGAAQTGSRWQNATRSTAGFTLRHPPGL
jgi:cell wall-associated NlpC family hydrolase